MIRIYQTQPKLHRGLVTSVDEGDLASTAAGIVTRGYHQCRFDITINGEEIEYLEVQVLFFNSRLNRWFGGGKYTFDGPGSYAITTDTRGATVFMAVTGFEGGEFEFSADYCLS